MRGTSIGISDGGSDRGSSDGISGGSFFGIQALGSDAWTVVTKGARSSDLILKVTYIGGRVLGV